MAETSSTWEINLAKRIADELHRLASDLHDLSTELATLRSLLLVEGQRESESRDAGL
jgi:hypothetical protein